MLKLDDDSPFLSEHEAEMFHAFTMKVMLLVKSFRLDLEPGFALLSSRARASAQEDWSTLAKALSFMLGTKDEVLTSSSYDSPILHWRTDVEFGVYPDMMSHDRATFRMRFGETSSSSTKQKMNSRSSTEAELIFIDDKTSKVTWSKRFTEA